jgi:hypothetical protein
MTKQTTSAQACECTFKIIADESIVLVGFGLGEGYSTIREDELAWRSLPKLLWSWQWRWHVPMPFLWLETNWRRLSMQKYLFFVAVLNSSTQFQSDSPSRYIFSLCCWSH